MVLYRGLADAVELISAEVEPLECGHFRQKLQQVFVETEIHKTEKSLNVKIKPRKKYQDFFQMN